MEEEKTEETPAKAENKGSDENNYIWYGLLALVLLALLFSIAGFFISAPIGVDKSIANTQISSSPDYNLPKYNSIDTGSTDNGDVSIELTPVEIGDNTIKIGIAANTHSVDLSQFDFRQITTLSYNEKSVKPASAPSLSGHHANGELVFNVDEKAGSFTIKIVGIPKVEERIFKWDKI